MKKRCLSVMLLFCIVANGIGGCSSKNNEVSVSARDDTNIVDSEKDVVYKPELYEHILQEYNDAISTFHENGENAIAEEFPNVSEFLVSNTVECGMSIWYGYYDIDGNGIDELFFSYETTEGDEYKIVDVFSQDGEKVQKIGEEDTFSEHTESRVYENGVIYNSLGNQKNYYVLNADGYHLDLTEKPNELGEEIKIEWEKLEIPEEITTMESDYYLVESTEKDSVSLKNIYGTWYSKDADRAYMFKSTGSDIYVTDTGISAVDGTYDVIDLAERTVDNGGYDLSEDMIITLYNSKHESYEIHIDDDSMMLNGYSYTHVSEDLQNQFPGIWKNENGYIEFGDEKFIQYFNSGEKHTYPYYVLSDCLLAVNYSGITTGSYSKVEYQVDGLQLTLNGDVYWKDGSDNSAEVLSGIRDIIVGYWYNDSWHECYMFYEGGGFERYHTMSDYKGGISLGTMLESGDYEIENSQLLKLYPNGDRYSWQEFTYNAQDESITNGIVYKKIGSLE